MSVPCPDHPTNDDADCRACDAVQLVLALERVTQELAEEWGILAAQVEQELDRRLHSNTLTETPLVSQWLSLFSTIDADGTFRADE